MRCAGEMEGREARRASSSFRAGVAVVIAALVAWHLGGSEAAAKGYPAPGSSQAAEATTTEPRLTPEECRKNLVTKRTQVFLQAFHSLEAMLAANEDFRKAYSSAPRSCQEAVDAGGDPDFTQWAGTLIALSGHIHSLALQAEQPLGYLEWNRLVASAGQARDQALDASFRLGQEKVTPECTVQYDADWKPAADPSKVDGLNPRNLICDVMRDWDAINKRWGEQQAKLNAKCGALVGMIKNVMAVDTTTADDVATKYKDTYAKTPDCQDLMGDADQLLSMGIIVGIGRQLQKIAVFVDRASDEKELTAYAEAGRKGIVQVEQAYINIKSNGKELENPNCLDPSGSSDPYDPIRYYCDAESASARIAYLSRLRISATKSLCGGINPDGTLRHLCFSYGFISSNLSQIWLLRNRPEGLEGGRLVSIAVPYAGVRWIPSLNVSYLAVDLSVYSAYFTSASSDLSTKATTCTAGMNQLERLLPCEANPQMRPYAAMQLGVTIGRSGIGYVTASPISFGIAQIGNQGLAPYYGMVVSSLQITGQF